MYQQFMNLTGAFITFYFLYLALFTCLPLWILYQGMNLLRILQVIFLFLSHYQLSFNLLSENYLFNYPTVRV